MISFCRPRRIYARRAIIDYHREKVLTAFPAFRTLPNRLVELVRKMLPLGAFAVLVYGAASGEGMRASLYGPHDRAYFEGPTEIVARSASLRVDVADASLVIASADGARATRLELSLVVGGNARALSALSVHATREHGDLVLRVDESRELPACTLRFTLDRAIDAFAVELLARPDVSLRFDVSRPSSVFVTGIGVLADQGTVNGKSVLLDEEPMPLALASRDRALYATWSGDDREHAHLAVTVGEPAAPADTSSASRGITVRLVADVVPAELTGRAFAATGEETKPLRLVTTGTTEPARVFGSDDEGHPLLRMRARPDDHVTVAVPARVTRYYAAIDADDSSAPIRFEPGLPWDLVLDVSPGGELRVRVTDGDSDAPLTSRIVVRGIDGTLDPSFGPDYRASGAGPIMDSLRGDVTTPLPKGRYRVLATKGLEYNVDAETVEIQSGKKKSVELVLRHVLDTPNMVACDLHVHARPSFDTPVSQEDRVLSLVSAGIEFAVPTEHNIVGDYGPSIEVMGLARELGYVTGVEVTTYNPRFGHFGVFPFPTNAGIPYKGTTIGAVFSAAKAGDPSRVLVVHHPRLPKQIGYFDVVGFDPRRPQTLQKVRMDFDALEVFNGYEKDDAEKVQRVLDDYYALLDTGRRFAATGSSDSHRIQYQWAGYPRTMALVAPEKGGAHERALDTDAVVSAIKHAHALVTSGPLVEMTIDGKGPGDELATGGKASATAHVRVRAAPWVDVTSVDIVAAGKILATIPIESRPTEIGKVTGDASDLAAKVLRFEGNVEVTLAPGTKWALAVARGKRKLDDVLPFMPVEPIGLTNPVWISGI